MSQSRSDAPLDPHQTDPSAGERGDGYKVVVNHEGQYSIWPSNRELPLGWRETGKTGSKAECLAYIELVWKEMRPRPNTAEKKPPRNEA